MKNRTSFSNKTCDQCSNPFTHMRAEYTEIADRKGNYLETRFVRWLYGCADHPVQNIVTYKIEIKESK